MAFENGDLVGSVTEFNLGGTWTSVTGDVLRDGQITITGGVPDRANKADPASCVFVLKNPANKYSPRNPMSPYYGQLQRGTPVRVSVPYGATYLRLNEGGYADCADSAPLRISGDIDIRVDVELDNMIVEAQSPNAVGQADLVELAGRVSAGGNASWAFYAGASGHLYLYWTTDGTNYAPFSASSAPVVIPANGRLAVRVTLDVDNGASGHTTTFYTAPTISGPWTQLGTAQVAAGTTSIFAGTGITWVGNTFFSSNVPPQGGINAFQLRSGIGGTLVANPVFSLPAVGSTSFTDSTGITWFTGGSSTITRLRSRFRGQVYSFAQQWTPGGADRQVRITAAGVLRQLGRGTQPIQSALAHRVPFFSPLAYWSLEDPAGSTSGASGVIGGRAMKTSNLDWASDTSLAGSNPLPVINTGGGTATVLGYVPPPAASVTSWQAEFAYKMATANTTLRTYLQIGTTGTARTITIFIRDTLTTVTGLDDTGATVFTNSFGTGADLFGAWVRIQFLARQNGGNVTWAINFIHVDDTAGGFATSSYAGSVGHVTTLGGPPDGYSSDLDGMVIGHFSVFPSSSTANYAYDGAVRGFPGEMAGDRLTRLSGETGNALTVRGDTSQQEVMGPQTTHTFLDLADETAVTDGGLLLESRSSASLVYRGRDTLYAQTPAVTLSYTTSGQIMVPADPVDDDLNVTNSWVVDRAGGSSSSAEQDDGPVSVLPAPSGIGEYPDSQTVNVLTDARTADEASWLVHLGTQDESRIASLNVYLHTAGGRAVLDAVAGMIVGDVVRLSNLPAWWSYDSAYLMMFGYTETISNFEWQIAFNCRPAKGWDVYAYSDPSMRYDSEGSTLSGSMTTTATSAGITSSDGSWWTTDPYDFPFSISVGGERMTVQAIGTILNTNPYLEVNATGWTGSGATAVWSSARLYPDGASGGLLITPDGVSASGGANGAISGVGTVTAGASYVACMWVYSPGGWSDLRPAVDWFTSAGAFLSSSLGSGFVVPAGTWTFLTQTFVAPASSSQGSMRARHGGTPSSGDNYTVWALRLMPVPAAPASSQTLTVVRSVNGVVKTHAAGETVSLMFPRYYGL